ncbi:MAG: metallophosphoesterase family protein [Nanopusillaceae archaeon]
MLEFTGKEALIFKKKYLIVSDLHIGIERELFSSGINIPTITDYLIKKIENLYKKCKVSNIIIVGDLKHNVPKISILEMKEIPYFIEKLKEIFDNIYIIKGNHDGGLSKILKENKRVKLLKELKTGKVVFTHGNRRSNFDGDIYIIGHHHFVYNLKTSIGESIYEKVFVIGNFDGKEIIILPAFSDLAGYWEVGSFHGPIAKKIKNYSIFTLEGILIKEIWI